MNPDQYLEEPERTDHDAECHETDNSTDEDYERFKEARND